MSKFAPKVFFNASVILAGLYSPAGGSGKLLVWNRKKKINGIISEIIIDEAVRHADKIGLTEIELEKKIIALFNSPCPVPQTNNVEKYNSIVLDHGDSHILASCEELEVDYLVTLDKKHLLTLSDKIKLFQICSPKQLIEKLSE